MSVYPTPFSDVNIVLEELLSAVQSILGENFAGLYLYGSLASGDFNTETSDIDFVVVTRDKISDGKFAKLKAMHKRFAGGELKWAKKLEGSYIPQTDLCRYNRSNTEYPTLNEGKFYLAKHSSDWIIQRHILREQGVVIAGLPLKDLIDEVSPDDLRQAARGILNEWWLPMLDNPAWLRSEEYQAYAVLTMCRALFTVENGAIASKPVSASRIQENIDKRYADLIEQALQWRPGDEFNKLDETLDFIRYTVDKTK